LAALKRDDEDILTLSENPAENKALGEIEWGTESFDLIVKHLFNFLTKGHQAFAKMLADEISNFYMNDIENDVRILFSKSILEAE